MTHTSFATTTRGPDRDLPPMRLYGKAKDKTLDEVNHVMEQVIESEDA